MWLFTKDGFFRVVCARQGDGAHGRPVDLSKVMVRARSRRHLEALKTRYPQYLAACDIVEFQGSDYACRIFVDKATWTAVIADLADDIDYDNFKAAVGRHRPSADRAYEAALHDVWQVMHGLQARDGR
jgi:hypothetical protein